MSSDPLLLSLKYPWPASATDETSLTHLIQRIHHQRGHFRDVNEAVLLSEIASAPSPSPPSPSSSSLALPPISADSSSFSGDDASAPDRAAQLKAAKLEIQSHVFAASTEARKALDYLSLLVSLHSPQAGQSTLSADLKGVIPAGALGVDRISRKPDPRAERDDAVVARAWKLDALNSAADALLGASKKLGAEVEKETKYWEQVLAIRDEGWLITRMPRERNALGVRFGFAEAAPEFKNKGIGALRRGEDGSVIMDEVETGARGRAMLRVRVLKGGEVVGTSVQCGAKGGNGVRETIERARNFIYEEELFFEITREARVLASQGIRTSEDSVTIDLSEGHRIVIDMAPLDEEQTLPDTSLPHAMLAQGVVLALRILLSYNHRLNLRKRSKPPPPLSTTRKVSTPPLYIIRPIAAHLYHQRDLTLLEQTLSKLRAFSTTAGLPCSYRIHPLQNCQPNSGAGTNTGAGVSAGVSTGGGSSSSGGGGGAGGAAIHDVDSAVQTFLSMLETSATLELPGGWTVSVTMRTTLSPPVQAIYPYSVTTAHDGVAAKLLGENHFRTHEELAPYLRWCLQRSVVNEIRCRGGWKQEALGNEMVSVRAKAVAGTGVGGGGGDGAGGWEGEGAASRKGGRRVRVEVDELGLGVAWGYTEGRSEKYVWDGTFRDRSLEEVLADVAAPSGDVVQRQGIMGDE